MPLPNLASVATQRDAPDDWCSLHFGESLRKGSTKGVVTSASRRRLLILTSGALWVESVLECPDGFPLSRQEASCTLQHLLWGRTRSLLIVSFHFTENGKQEKQSLVTKPP